MKEAVMSHLLHTAVLSDAQHGFVPKRSCLTNLLLTEQWETQFMDAYEPVDVVFLDVTRAFDSVNHRYLYIKLDSYGVHPKIIEWVRSFLTHRSFRVPVHYAFSLPFSAGQWCSSRISHWASPVSAIRQRPARSAARQGSALR